MTRNLWGRRVPLRDGTELATDVYLPGDGDGPWPAVLMRTPYGRQLPFYSEPAQYLAAHGYAVACQDVRGRGDSDGSFYPFFNKEGPDGHDTIEWLAEQPWCLGRVGMMGGSYAAWVQWCAAATRPPHLVTMVSASAAAKWMQQMPFHNGVPTALAVSWLHSVSGRTMQNTALLDMGRGFVHLPLVTMDTAVGTDLPIWREWLSRPVFDEVWKSRRLSQADFAAIDLPVLHITGTYDGTQPGALEVWRGMHEHSPSADRQFMVFGPWDHLAAASHLQKPTIGGVDFGADAVVDVLDLHRRWFDRWLRTDARPGADEPRARVFLTGTNAWQDAVTWPPPAAVATHLWVDRGGQLAPQPPGTDGYDEFVYDPEKPVTDVPDLAVYSRPDPLNPVEPPLVRDFVETRHDVLVYSSAALTESLTVAGEPTIVLYGSSDAPDTDWHAWITDVDPDGRSITLTRGRIGARFRESLEYEVLMTPGEVYAFRFEFLSIAHVFRPGHRVRLVIASSDVPIYGRNLNTGHPIGQDAEVRVARNRVHRSPAYATHLTLPTVDSRDLQPGGAM